MVANMTVSSHAKQPPLSSPSKETALPRKHPWLFKLTDTSKSAKADSGGRSSMIPSPDESSNSWETRAFAEDASSLAAGIWPPRAYPCSFCRREFRSAQALGGHMNVHRRDRARLRHSSPVPVPTPYCAPQTVPQPRSLVQAHEKYTITHTGGYPNESLIKLNSAPITLSKHSNPPANTPHTSVISSYRSNNATSFPLRLQQLASEAAASLMCSQPCDSTSDLLSLWPTTIAKPAVSLACHSSMGGSLPKERTMEVSSSSSLSSAPSSNGSSVRPSRTDAIPCRRDAPIIQPEDESPPKKSHTDHKTYSYPFKHGIMTIADDTSYSDERRGTVYGGDIDLELRLGQTRPP